MAYLIPQIAIPLTIPTFQMLSFFSEEYPLNYKGFEQASNSGHKKTVKSIVKRIMNSENSPGQFYYVRIQRMLERLPNSYKGKNIESLIKQRFKFVSVKGSDPKLLYWTGTELDSYSHTGKIYIAISSCLDKTSQKALPWQIARQMSFILHRDRKKIRVGTTLTSFSIAILSTVVAKWDILQSFGATLLAHTITYAIMSRLAETRADDFANRYCTEDERSKAIPYLEQMNTSPPKGIFNRFWKMIHFPLKNRIEKIQAR